MRTMPPRRIANGRHVERAHGRSDFWVSTLLIVIGAATFWRGTGMWFGYPTSQGENATVDPAIMQTLLYTIGVLTIIPLLVYRRSIGSMLRSCPWQVVAVVGAIVASVFFSAEPIRSLRGMAAVLLISAPMVLVKARFGASGANRLLRRTVAVLLLINTAYVVLAPGYAVMTGSLAGSVRAMFLHKNEFGTYCAATAILLLPTAEGRERRWFLPRLALMMLAIGMVGLSRSSTAVITLAVGLAVVFGLRGLTLIRSRSYRQLLITGFTVTAASLGLIGGIALLATVSDQFGKDVTLSGRTELWEGLANAAWARPWLGYGFAMFRDADFLQQFTRNILWGPRSTHNTYLEMALCFGIPATILWAQYVLATIFRRSVGLTRGAIGLHEETQEIAVLFMILIGSLTEAGQMFSPTALWPIMVLILSRSGNPAPHDAPAKVPDRPRVRSRLQARLSD